MSFDKGRRTGAGLQALHTLMAAAGLAAAGSQAHAQTQPAAGAAPAPLVFFDVAGPDAGSLSDFYRRVFGWTVDASGAFTVPVTAPLAAQIRADPAEKRLYIGVRDVAAALELVTAHGGSIDAPRFEVPGVVVLGLFRDPAGNPMGLVELDNGRAKVP